MDTHPQECGDTAYQAAAMPDECTCTPTMLEVRRRILRLTMPEWRRRALEGVGNPFAAVADITDRPAGR